MSSGFFELVAGLAPLIASHLELVVVALVAAIAISLPIAIAVADRPRIGAPVIAIAGVIQTIPGLALLALMVPTIAVTGGLGIGISPFGFSPAVIALTLYAILPILRSTVVGLRGVDPAVVEAATGMGMTRGQLRWQVELPLAAPVIAAGIRTATVWTVGAATLATPVGQRCLGNYIFAGLQTRNWPMLLLGVVASAGLAIVLDLVLAAIEYALASRRPRRAWIPAVGLATVIALIAGVVPRVIGTPRDPDRGAPAATAVAASSGARAAITHLRIGAKTFTEQYLLVEVLRARLARVGITVELIESLGSTVIFDALRHDDVDAYVDYSGTIWANHMSRPPGTPRWQILAEVEAWLAREHHVRSLGSLGFENAYALALSRATATRLGVHSLADLTRHAPALSLGADYEFLGRREWAAVSAAYDLRFARTASFDPSLLYDAVARGEVDVISAFSSDGRIAATDLVVLDDPAGALPPYDAMILLAPAVANDPGVACALEPLRGALRIELVRMANAMIDRTADKRSPRDAAAWLLAQLGPLRECIH